MSKTQPNHHTAVLLNNQTREFDIMKVKGVFLLLASFLAFFTSSQAQILEPVNWNFEVISDKDNNFELVANCNIDYKWHVYALNVSDDPEAFGPIPTSLEFDTIPGVTILGNATEKKEYITHFDPNFDMDLNYFESTASFARSFKINDPSVTRVNAELNYMACDDKQCIFPDPVNVKMIFENGAFISVATYDPFLEEQGNSGAMNIEDPVSWEFTSEALGNGEYNMVATATIDEGWHIYSQNLSSMEGPLPTLFTWEGPNVELVGTTSEPEPIVEYDPNFMMDLEFFEHNPQFVQKIKVTDGSKPVVKASVDFMVCNDEKCLPPELREFEIDLASGKGSKKSCKYRCKY